MKATTAALVLLFICPVAQALPKHCQDSVNLQQIQKRQLDLGFSENRLTQWHPVESPRSVALSIHGLNMKPDKMQSVISMLNQVQVSVLNVTLEGHGENFKNFEKVSKEKWLSNFQNAYCVARMKSEKLNIALLLFGYSTGATVALAAEARNPSFQFQQRILMSPAIVMSLMSNMVRLLFPLEFINLPSRAHKKFRAHAATPIPAYKALFQLADEIVHNAKAPLNGTDTLVLIDPKDELVNFEKLEALMQKRNLSRWSLFKVFNLNGKDRSPAPHHAIIDEYFTGKAVWSELSNRTQNFIKSAR